MNSQMMGVMNGFNPMSYSPVLYVNPYKDAYVSTVDNNGLKQRGNIIDSATATTGQSLANAGTLASKCVNNGEGWYFELGAQLTTGSTSDYNFLHDGTDFDIWATIFVCPISGTYERAILTNNNYTNNNRGILFRINSVAGNNNLKFTCGNNAANFINLSANGAITPNTTHVIRVTRSGSSAKMYVNGSQVASQTIGLSPGVGNASGIMTVVPNGLATANLYLKDVVIFNRALTTNEATKMNSRTFKSITPAPMNVYLLAGDSNTAGRGDNPSIAPDLTSAINGAYASRLNALIDSSVWPGKLQLGVNQTLISENISTQHGSEMRFGKSMGAVKDTFLIKYGIGSIPLYQRASGDWNVATSGSYYSNWITKVIPQSISDLVHVYRRTPVFRGFIWTHGANDAFVGGSSVTWARVGTTVTVTKSAHGLLTGHKIPITASSELGAIPIGIYTATKIDNNVFTIVGIDSGATSGTISYSAGSKYKENLTAVLNGTINHLTNTIFNDITGTSGFTVNKLRVFIPETRSGGVGFSLQSYADVVAGQIDIKNNYLIDNPTFVGKVLAVHSESTEDLAMSDTIHYTTAGYDTLGQREADYFLPFNNE